MNADRPRSDRPRSDRPRSDCPQCEEPTGPDDNFCENCGADLKIRQAAMYPHPTEGIEKECPRCGTHSLGEYCDNCGLRHRDGTDHVEMDCGAAAGISDRGLRHARNEDAMSMGVREPGDLIAAVVCDGVSTVHEPELASRAAAKVASGVLLAAPQDGESAEERLRAAVAAAAAAVAELPFPEGKGGPSCTLVAALVERPADDITTITVAWVGDSRAYWLAADGAVEPAKVLTADHSWAVVQVAAGWLDAATANADPRSHALTRWIGAEGSFGPEVATLRPAGPGALLLCSDGLWNYLPDAAAIAAVALPELAKAGPLAAAADLVALALEAGGRDNVTVVVIPVGGNSL